LFNTFLTAFGPVRVSDKAAFGRRMMAWFARDVREE
jgi:hypothetical protein